MPLSCSGSKRPAIVAFLLALSFSVCQGQTTHPPSKTAHPPWQRATTNSSAPAIDQDIDPEIATIAVIKAIDNHAHPVLPPPNGRTDRNFDALPVDNMEAETDPVAWRPDNPQLAQAWKALWNFDGVASTRCRGYETAEQSAGKGEAREGQHYAEWVLDQAGIGTMLSNRVAMGARALCAALPDGSLISMRCCFRSTTPCWESES